MLALVTGVPSGLAMGIFLGVQDGNLPLALYGGAAFGVFFGLEAVVAILGSPWLWLAVVTCVGLAALQPFAARRTEHRIAVLRGAIYCD